jgi:hypothetical protein
VALARKLAGVLWAMWRDGTVYDPGFQVLPSTRKRGKRSSPTRERAGLQGEDADRGSGFGGRLFFAS